MSRFRFFACCTVAFFLELYSGTLSAQKVLNLDEAAYGESYYSTGYYYLPDSTKKSGLIKYTFRVPGSFRFKDSLNARAITVNAADCIGFHEDGDKADFHTLSNVTLSTGLVPLKLSKCFAELRISGDLCLYLVYFEKNGPNVGGMGPQRVPTSRYMLKKKHSDVVQEVPKKAKHFKKELADFLSDKPKIVEFINSHDYTEDEIEMVVQAYNRSK